MKGNCEFQFFLLEVQKFNVAAPDSHFKEIACNKLHNSLYIFSELVNTYPEITPTHFRELETTKGDFTELKQITDAEVTNLVTRTNQ